MTADSPSSFSPREPVRPGPDPILPEDLRELSNVLDDLAALERAKAHAELEERVFSVSVEQLADRLPAELQPVHKALSLLALSERQSPDSAFEERIAEASFAALSGSSQAHAGTIPATHSVLSRIHSTQSRSTTTTTFARAARRWRVAAILFLTAGSLAISLFMFNRQQTIKSNLLPQAQAKELISRVDARLSEMWSSFENNVDSTASSSDVLDPYDLNDYLSDQENAS